MGIVEKCLSIKKRFDEIDREYISHCNRMIRSKRKALKRYGDVGEYTKPSTMIHEALRARARTKAFMATRDKRWEARIKFLEDLNRN